MGDEEIERKFLVKSFSPRSALRSFREEAHYFPSEKRGRR